jgi:hypothetical protein
MLDQLKAKGRELLVVMVAASMLLSVAGGVVMDALLILLVGAVGWFTSSKPSAEG